ncbi:potassium channel family protein [Streptomyces sp. NPDC046821]|uniref:potassium channel family protein n=1 Tax=Streptomyces sp. NPDC046821 TaxID=3154702 RepID=UPI003403A25D
MSVDDTLQYANLEPRRRRRLVLWAVLKASVTPVVLLVLYYVLPLDQAVGSAEAIWFLVGFLAFAAVVWWQAYSITHHPHPRLRAIQALTTTVPVFLLVFAGTYFLLDAAAHDSFSESLNRTDSLYFTVTVFTTVGFGDITPKTETARVLVMFQMLGGLVLVGLVAKLFLGAVQIGIQRRSSGTPPKKQ